MAGGADRSQKTEKPTPKRLREAREKGQVAKSPDLTAWISMLIASQMLKITVANGAKTFRTMFENMGRAAAKPDTGSASKFAADSAKSAVMLIAPFLILLMLIVIVVGLSQVGLKPNLKRLKPEFGRLNVMKGLKKLFSPQSYWELAKSIMKITVLVVVAWPAISHITQVFTSKQGDSLDKIAGLTATTALTIIRNVSVAALVVAAADYIVQRRRTMKDISMTKQEVKDEYKQNEGNPEVRQAIRSRQAAIGRNRMIGLVGGADVVVVNPTHYAVALKYDVVQGAPQVIAKGAGVMAKRIRAEAETHNVPIVHEPVLTRTLYKSCNLGAFIPVELYEAVAQVLAFVFSLRAKGKADGYHEMPVNAPAF
jgi:flagellar biosynthetic protein FlhB